MIGWYSKHRCTDGTVVYASCKQSCWRLCWTTIFSAV